MNATDAAIEAATIETGRYRVARISGRYRVIDNGGAILATVASKAVGQKWIDRKVQTAVELAEQAVAERDGFAANRAAASLAADLAEAPAVVAEQVAAVEEAPADARSARATELADAVAAGQVSFDAAATELLGGAPAVRVLPRTDVEDRVEASMARKGPAPEVVARAVARFQAELDATAPALGKVMSEPLPGEASPVEEAPAAAQERPTMPEGAVVRHVIVTAAGRLPFASRSRATRAFEAAVAAGQPVAWESAAGRVLRSHPGN